LCGVCARDTSVCEQVVVNEKATAQVRKWEDKWAVEKTFALDRERKWEDKWAVEKTFALDRERKWEDKWAVEKTFALDRERNWEESDGEGAGYSRLWPALLIRHRTPGERERNERGKEREGEGKDKCVRQLTSGVKRRQGGHQCALK
jgi:hypothetical protein